MKKDELKYRFIEMRALGYTYKKICSELEINQQQKYLMSNIFSQRIVEQEQGIMIKLEQLRRTKGMNLPKKISDKIDKKIIKGLEKIFIKKISVIHLKISSENITHATFIFDDDVVVKS